MPQQTINPTDSLRVGREKINANFDDIFTRLSQTVNPATFPGNTPEEQIQNAINHPGVSIVETPLSMLPFNVDQVIFNDAVKMTREGGLTAAGVWDAAAYGGKHSSLGYSEQGYTIREAVKACAANGGGTVDCQGFPASSVILLAVDICSLLNAYEKVPITFVWGGHEIRIKTRQKPRSHHHHTFIGTKIILKDENSNRVTGSVFPFYTNSIETMPAGGIITTVGSAVVTLATPSDPIWAMLEVGSPFLINGFVPPIGVDKTTINVGGGIDAVTSTITVVSTTAFHTASDANWPSGGRLRIENEIISYTSKTATQFLGCTRGVEGTTAAAHANGITVNRISYQPFTVLEINGADITLDGVMNISASNLAVQLGHLDVSFDGIADFDGNKDPGSDDLSGPMGLWINGTRKLYIGPGLFFHHWDHGGWSLTGCQDCVVLGRGSDNGYLPGSVGVGFWVFGWNKRLTVDILEIAGCITGLYVDDRSVTPQVNDGPAEDSSFRIRRATRMGYPGGPANGLVINGARNCTGAVERAQFIAGLTGCNGIVTGDGAQWGDGTTLVSTGLILDMGVGESPDGTYLAINVGTGANGANTCIVRPRASISNFQPKNTVITASAVFSLTYGATVNTNASRVEIWALSVTNGTAFTFANPTNLTDGRIVEYYIQNNSGGAMGAVTFGSKFRLAGAFVAPAAGQARTYRFRYYQVLDKLIEEFRSPADQPI